MQTRSMQKQKISYADREAASILMNLKNDNEILRKLKDDKEEKEAKDLVTLKSLKTEVTAMKLIKAYKKLQVYIDEIMNDHNFDMLAQELGIIDQHILRLTDYITDRTQ